MKMKKMFLAFFAVCALFLVSSCSESDDDNSSLMMMLMIKQRQESNSFRYESSTRFGATADGSKYELKTESDSKAGKDTISYKLTSAEKNVTKLLTIYKTGSEYDLVFTLYDKEKTFTIDSYGAVGFMADSVARNLQSPVKYVPENDKHTFNVMGTIPSETVTAIKNCTTLEFIVKDPNGVSPQISIPFAIVLRDLKSFM